MAVYDIKKLSVRYGISEAGIRKFINENLGKINQSGIHVKKVGKSFTADEEAVKIIDQLRNVGVTVVEEAVSDDRILKLTEENSQLKTQLLLVMKELADANREAKAAYKELADSKILQIEVANAQEELKDVKKQLELKDKEIIKLKADVKQKDKEAWDLIEDSVRYSNQSLDWMKQYYDVKSELDKMKMKYEPEYRKTRLQQLSKLIPMPLRKIFMEDDK